jgi:Tfp pilus assembly protein PilO
MNIKLLLTPTLIIVGVYVLIAFVKPDYDTYMQRRAERDQAKAYAEKVTDVVANSSAVTTQVSGNKEATDTVVNYLPAAKDEARSLDSLNFLTTQAGLVTVNIILKDAPDLGGGKMPRAAADNVFAADATQTPVDVTATPAAVMIPPYATPRVQQYEAQLEAVGTYTGIKDLVTKLQGLDRLHLLQNFEVSLNEGGGEEGSAGALTVKYLTLFPYQAAPKAPVGEVAVSFPVLQASSMDFSAAQEIQNRTTNRVPASPVGTEGKANPFE